MYVPTRPMKYGTEKRIYRKKKHTHNVVDKTHADINKIPSRPYFKYGAPWKPRKHEERAWKECLGKSYHTKHSRNKQRNYATDRISFLPKTSPLHLRVHHMYNVPRSIKPMPWYNISITIQAFTRCASQVPSENDKLAPRGTARNLSPDQIPFPSHPLGFHLTGPRLIDSAIQLIGFLIQPWLGEDCPNLRLNPSTEMQVASRDQFITRRPVGPRMSYRGLKALAAWLCQ